MPADDCGLGLKDLLLIITCICEMDYSIYLIEEPENHLHADFQKKLLNFISSFEDKQFFISTHSNVFLDSNKVDRLFYCWFDKSVQVSDKTSMSKIVDALGYSITENLTADAIIFTEGPTDIPIVKKMLQLNGVVDHANIKFWPLGGDIMGELDLSIFKGMSNIFALIDKDPGSAKVRNKFMDNCAENGITCVRLERYSIENYLPLSAIKNAFPNEIPQSIKVLDPDKPVDEQIGFKEKKKSIKGRNHRIVGTLKAEDLVNTDLWDFGTSIKEHLEKSS